MNTLRGIAFASAMLAGTAAAYGQCKPNFVAQIPVTIENNQAFIPGVQLNAQPVATMLDTGAAFSFLWQNEAARLGLRLTKANGAYHMYGAGGEGTVFVTVIDHFQMGSFVGDQLDLLVMGTLNDTRRAPLLLGDDLFSHYVTEYDFAHGVVRLFKPTDCQPAQMMYWSKTYSMAELERLSSQDPKIKLAVQVNGKRLIAILDSGSQLSTVDRNAAVPAGVIKSDAESTQSFTGISGRPHESWLGYFATLAVGDEVLKNAKFWVGDVFSPDQESQTGSRLAYTPDNLPQMMLGCDFFLSHRMIVFPKEHQLLFTYNGGPILQVVRSVPAWNKEQEQIESAPVTAVPSQSH
jgi:predicted aspartyl protease